MNELSSGKVFGSAAGTKAPLVSLDIEVVKGPCGEPEIVEVGIVDHNHNVVLHSLCQPSFAIASDECRPGLPARQLRVAQSFETAIPSIQEAVKGTTVVMYNSLFDGRFLGDSLDTAADIHCAMTRFAGRGGRYSKRHRSYQWVRLDEALQIAGIPKPRGNYHRALVDAEATLLLWQWMEATDRTICETHHPAFLGRLF